MVFDKAWEEGVARKGVMDTMKLQEHNKRIMELQEKERTRHVNTRNISRDASTRSTRKFLSKEHNETNRSLQQQTQQVTNYVLFTYGLLWINDYWFHWHLYKIFMPAFVGGLLYLGMHIETFQNTSSTLVYALVSCLVFSIAAMFIQFEKESGSWVYLIPGKVFSCLSNILIFCWFLLKL